MWQINAAIALVVAALSEPRLLGAMVQCSAVPKQCKCLKYIGGLVEMRANDLRDRVQVHAKTKTRTKKAQRQVQADYEMSSQFKQKRTPRPAPPG